MKPAARSAVGPSTLPSIAAPRRGGGGGGGGGSPVEHVPFPDFSNGWSVLNDAGIVISPDSCQWFEQGAVRSPLTPAVPAVPASLSIIVASNPVARTLTVRLWNPDLDTNEIVYQDIPAEGPLTVDFTPTEARGYIDLEGSDSGLAIEFCSLQTGV